MKLRHRAFAVGAVGVAAIGMTGLTASSASAATAGCGWQAVCLYYSPSLAGSSSYWTAAEDNYGSQNFLSSGAGQGQNVQDNAASSWNTHATYYARVYADTSWNGYWQKMNHYGTSTDSINLDGNLRNKNDSHKFTIS